MVTVALISVSDLDFDGDEGALDYEAGEQVWPTGQGKTCQAGGDRHGESVGGGGGLASRLEGGEDVLLGKRMLVQVGGAVNGGAGSGRRVVEVITASGGRHVTDGQVTATAKSSSRVTKLTDDMRDITIKVERTATGTEHKENRKIVIERVDKNKNKLSKTEKSPSKPSKEDQIEDEVSRMRKRIVEKARKMVENEEKERMKVTTNGVTAAKLMKIENEKVKPTKPKKSETPRAAVTDTTQTLEELEAIKDITEGVAVTDDMDSVEKPLLEDTEVEKSSNATAPVEDEDTLDGMQVEETEDILSLQVEPNLTEAPMDDTESGAVLAEVSTDTLQLTVDPREKALMEAEAEDLEAAADIDKPSRSESKSSNRKLAAQKENEKNKKSSSLSKDNSSDKIANRSFVSSMSKPSSIDGKLEVGSAKIGSDVKSIKSALKGNSKSVVKSCKPDGSEGKSAAKSGKLDVTEGKSALKSGKPDVPEGKSAVKIGKPDVTEFKSVVKSGKPDVTDGKSVVKSSKPDVTDGKSVVKSGKPGVTEGKYVVKSGKPDVTEGKSVTKSGKPDLTEGKSVAKSDKPDVTEGKSVTKSSKPETGEGKPLVKSGKPDATDGKSIVKGGKPVTVDAKINKVKHPSTEQSKKMKAIESNHKKAEQEETDKSRTIVPVPVEKDIINKSSEEKSVEKLSRNIVLKSDKATKALKAPPSAKEQNLTEEKKKPDQKCSKVGKTSDKSYKVVEERFSVARNSEKAVHTKMATDAKERPDKKKSEITKLPPKKTDLVLEKKQESRKGPENYKKSMASKSSENFKIKVRKSADDACSKVAASDRSRPDATKLSSEMKKKRDAKRPLPDDSASDESSSDSDSDDSDSASSSDDDSSSSSDDDSSDDSDEGAAVTAQRKSYKGTTSKGGTRRSRSFSESDQDDDEEEEEEANNRMRNPQKKAKMVSSTSVSPVKHKKSKESTSKKRSYEVERTRETDKSKHRSGRESSGHSRKNRSKSRDRKISRK